MSEEARSFCREILEDVSRSFALTIPMLDDELRDPVTIIYLQDRLLDNFEDELPDVETGLRQELMDEVVEIFRPEHSSLPAASVERVQSWAGQFGDSSLARLAANADRLWQAYNSLSSSVRELSFPWLEEMNQGMKKYLEEPVDTFSDLDEYCYYVAGTVGGFLSQLVIYTADPEEKEREILENNYAGSGKFLQKVNITRDIRADIMGRDRIFWPLEELEIEEAEELLEPSRRSQALSALEAMVDSALSHVPSLFKYLEAIPESLPGYRKFYCVNNAMGLATLQKLSGNYEVFCGDEPVRIPRWKTFMISKFPERYMRKLGGSYLD